MSIFEVRESDPLSLGLQFSEAIFSLPQSGDIETSPDELRMVYDANQIALALGFMAAKYRVHAEEGFILPVDIDCETNGIIFGNVLGENYFIAYFSHYELLKLGLPGEEIYVRDLALGLKPAEIVDGEDVGLFPELIPDTHLTKIPSSMVSDIIPA